MKLLIKVMMFSVPLKPIFIIKIQNVYAQLTDGLLCQDSRPEI